MRGAIRIKVAREYSDGGTARGILPIIAFALNNIQIRQAWQAILPVAR
jgi:hypothetical protein